MAAIFRKKNLISSDRPEAAHQHRNMPHERMYPGDLIHRRPGFFQPLHPHGNNLQRKTSQNNRLTDQVHQREKHCTKPVTLVAHQLSIGIFPPDHFPGILRENSGMNHRGNNLREKTSGRQKKEKESRIMGTGNSKINKTLKTIEPVTTVIDEGKFLRILAELPALQRRRSRSILKTIQPRSPLLRSIPSSSLKV